jgi:hypothetical protein
MRDVVRYSEAFKLRLVEDAAGGKYKSLDEAGRLYICLVLSLTMRPRRAPEPGPAKIQVSGGAEPRRSVRESATRFVRKGLEGRVAVAPNIKNMQCMFFIFDVTEPPQSPVFCGAACSFPRRGTDGRPFNRGPIRLHGRWLRKKCAQITRNIPIIRPQ